MSVLEGLKVIDLTRGCCGAYAAMQLADYGARVVRPGEPPLDPARDALHFGMEYQPDLQLPKGLEGAGVLLAEADTLPDGLTRSVLRTQHPKLVCAVIREDGAVGGPLAEAACGMMDMTGFPDGAPTLSGGQSAECFAGVSLCFAITAALQNVENGGEGAWIDYSLYDTFYSLLESPILFRELTGTCPGRCGSADPATLVPYDVFACQDGYFSAGLASDAGWDRFCNAIGMPELIDDPRYDTNEKRCERYEEMTALFAPFFAGRTRAQLQEIFSAANIPSAPVLSAEEAMENEQIQARGMVRQAPAARDSFPLTCSPMKMSVTKPVCGG